MWLLFILVSFTKEKLLENHMAGLFSSETPNRYGFSPPNYYAFKDLEKKIAKINQRSCQTVIFYQTHCYRSKSIKTEKYQTNNLSFMSVFVVPRLYRSISVLTQRVIVTWMRVCMCVCVCVCMYLYIYIYLHIVNSEDSWKFVIMY